MIEKQIELTSTEVSVANALDLLKPIIEKVLETYVGERVPFILICAPLNCAGLQTSTNVTDAIVRSLLTAMLRSDTQCFSYKTPEKS